MRKEIKELDGFLYSNMNTIIVLIAIIGFIVFMFASYNYNKREGLSLSQWMPFKEDCSQFIQKREPVLPEYPKNVKIDCNLPGDRRPRLKPQSFYATYSNDEKCSSCCPKPLLKEECNDFREVDLRTALNSPKDHDLNLPLVNLDLQTVYKGKLGDLTKKQVSDFLESGHLIVSANTPTQIEKLVQKLQRPNGNGYPNFTKIDGPVVYLKKSGSDYYYGIDYPSKWNPPNIHKYINKTPFTNFAFLAYESGAKLLEPCYPLVVLSSPKDSGNQIITHSPKLEKAECCKSVWGVPYGCGNWTDRV